MSSEQYNSAFTGAEIDEAISKVQNQAPILAGTAQTLTEDQKAQARENIGAVTAKEAEAHLDAKETVAIANLLQGTTWTTGFYYSSGDIAENIAEAIYGTRYSKNIAVTAGDTLTLVYTVPAEKASLMWQAICEFDSGGNWIQRIGGGVTGTVSGSYAVYTKEYVVPEGVSYLVLCARGIYDWTTPTEIDTSEEPTEVLRLEKTEVKTTYRLLPVPTAEDEGKTPVVINGAYSMQIMQTPERIAEYLSGQECNDLMDGRTWTVGYFYVSGGIAPADEAAYYGNIAYTDLFPVTAGKTYRYIYKVPADTSEREGTIKDVLELAFNEYMIDGTWIKRNTLTLPLSNIVGDYEIVKGEYVPEDGVSQVRVACRTLRADYNGSEVLTVYADGEEEIPTRLLPILTMEDEGKSLFVKDGRYVLDELPVVTNSNPNIRAINHRGFNTAAPENTLSAYRLSKKMGFEYAECDVSFTSDNVAVLLHDSTVDRTSDGTGDISTLTLEQVKAMDFGSWFSEEYAGEQIPTFEEFIILCKRIGLHPYIELKGNISATNAANLVALVKRYGMSGKVTWISFYQVALTNIKTADPSARLGYITESTLEDNITVANGFKTETNEVFINIGYYALTNDFLSLCVENDIPLEVWTINDANTLANLDPYISGYSSDDLLANEVLYDAYG